MREPFMTATLGIPSMTAPLVIKTKPSVANPEGSRIIVDPEHGLGIFAFDGCSVARATGLEHCALDVEDGCLGVRLPAEKSGHFIPFISPVHPQHTELFRAFATQANEMLVSRLYAPPRAA